MEPTPRRVFTLRTRAYDGDGALQISAFAQPHPDGASGYPVIAVSVDPA